MARHINPETSVEELGNASVEQMENIGRSALNLIRLASRAPEDVQQELEVKKASGYKEDGFLLEGVSVMLPKNEFFPKERYIYAGISHLDKLKSGKFATAVVIWIERNDGDYDRTDCVYNPLTGEAEGALTTITREEADRDGGGTLDSMLAMLETMKQAAGGNIAKVSIAGAKRIQEMLDEANFRITADKADLV